ncbi:MAG TPA: trehalose-6-phosphate synthase [Phycisphaerales bacterium]|nr:trehalose-6-phosphate synthase [Phycisphaerales bacterium]
MPLACGLPAPEPWHTPFMDPNFPGKLICVANRLPINRVGAGARARWVTSPGGLVSALEPVVKSGTATWVGWTGTAGPAPRPFTHNGMRVRPVGLSRDEVERYYNGLSNRTLWPLFHDAIRAPEFRQDWWRPYVEVNRRFARLAAGVAGPEDVVWVHDYHLMLVPMMLRELRPRLKIGFFLHIPFPPEELFAWLPWRRELLEGLLGADLVGFQTYANSQNFSRAARDYTEAEGSGTQLEFRGRRVEVGTYPISIDFDWFNARAGMVRTQRQAQDYRARIGDERRLILAVDRLDYTKGIDVRLRAIEELFRRRLVRVEDCVFMQIAVPSREPVIEYAEMRTRIEQLVGRINGEFSEPGRVAVHYFRRSFSREDLAAYYRAADVMAVTPLREGMNLVAKEYIATRTDNSGVLVLSEFAGAARELRRALLVNPRDLEGMVRTLNQALTMPAKDARHRMAILRTVVRRHDVHDWAQKYFEALLR